MKKRDRGDGADFRLRDPSSRSFGFVEMNMPEGWDEVPAVLKL